MSNAIPRGWVLFSNLDGQLWHYINPDGLPLCSSLWSDIAKSIVLEQPDVMTPGEDNCLECQQLVLAARRRAERWEL